MTEPTDKSSTELDENQKDLAKDDQSGAPDESDEAGDQEPDGQEVEIVLKGDEGSQPAQSNLGIRNRVRKLNAKVSAAQAGESQASSELATEREKNKLLQLALNQQKASPKGPPDPNDFDDGAKDAKYVEALEAHNREFFQSEMEKHTAAQSTPAANDSALERRQTEHYQAADKLGIPDYEVVEEKAIDILGKQTVNHLIKSLDNSPKLLYFLGKNPGKAEEIAEMLTGGDTVKAILEIGALSAGLIAQPKAKRKAAPDPDDDLEGASVSRTGNPTRGPAGATYE